jgi:hypothetical protein
MITTEYLATAAFLRMSDMSCVQHKVISFGKKYKFSLFLNRERKSFRPFILWYSGAMLTIPDNSPLLYDICICISVQFCKQYKIAIFARSEGSASGSTRSDEKTVRHFRRSELLQHTCLPVHWKKIHVGFTQYRREWGGRKTTNYRGPAVWKAVSGLD